MTIKEYKKIIKKIYSDFKKKYPEELWAILPIVIPVGLLKDFIKGDK